MLKRLYEKHVLLLFHNYFWGTHHFFSNQYYWGKYVAFYILHAHNAFFLAWKSKCSKKNLFDILMILILFQWL